MQTLRLYKDSPINFSTTNETTGLEKYFAEGTNVLLIILIALLIILIVLGNSIVILAFIVDKRLRSQSNFFLLNLAICDFLVGAFSIPLYIPFLFSGKWMLGRFLCKLWLILDFTTSAASAFGVVLISYDRFLSVTKAVLYRTQQRRHSQTALKMVVAWIFSFLIYGPAIIFWEILTGTYETNEYSCRAGFFDAWYFLLCASSLDFAFPMISISFFNMRIYWNIKKRSRKKRNSCQMSEEQKTEASPYIIATHIVLSCPKGKEKVDSSLNKTVNDFAKQSFEPSSQTMSGPPNRVSVIKLSRDKKVARSLTILVSVFALCWAPYSFLVSIRAACQGYCIDFFWYKVTAWLLWTNSAINPVLYPMCHKSFRKYCVLLCFSFPKILPLG
uniref:Histamine receptor H4 gene d1 n=1 Tax=Xenopus tropicalis TaxID=8364 RepID=A0A803J9H4_XENTR